MIIPLGLSGGDHVSIMKRGDRTVANGAGCSEGAKVKTQEMSLETRKMCHFLLISKSKFRDFSCVVSGFGEVFIVTRPKPSHLAVRERKKRLVPTED